MKYLLIASIAANAVIGAWFYQFSVREAALALADDQQYQELLDRHATLVQWACARGNGGWECGEE